MKLLKWITHPIYLLLIIIGAAIYLNRVALFTEGTAVAATPIAVAEQARAAVEAPVLPEAAPVRHDDPPTVDPSAQPDAAAAPVVEASAQQPVVTAEPLQAATESAAPAPLQPSLSTDTDTPATAAVGGEPVWRHARQLAWRGELDEAVDAYRRLAQQQPDNVDAFGEMGNVLMRAGRWEAAADAYADAARTAGRLGNEQLAWYLHSVIAGLDYEKAVTLRHELTAAKNPN